MFESFLLLILGTENLSIQSMGSSPQEGYILYQSVLAFFMSFIFVLICQPLFINWFKNHHFGQPIRDDGPKTHAVKQGTPTMGGLVLVAAVTLSCLFFADFSNIYVWAVLGITIGYGAIGFYDDFLKVRDKSSKGISARFKFSTQIGLATILVSSLVYFGPEQATIVYVPFVKNLYFDLSYFYIPFAVLVIVGASNAVNLTDGLDGLVAGPMITVCFAYGIFCYVAGHAKIAEYLHVLPISGAGDLCIFAAALLAAGIGFLWFNSYPAQVFMGDVGALAIGGAFGMLSVIVKQELILIVAGGVFVVEAMSVIIQVFYFKYTGGKRFFRMAPIHHHFELKGMSEPKIIVRAWIISFILAVLSIASLKFR